MLPRPITPGPRRSSKKTSARNRIRRSLSQGMENLESRVLMAADTYGPLPPPTEYFVATNGDDWNTGNLQTPFKTIRRALDAAHPGDTITLRNGVYEGGIHIDIDNLTIRSMPGEWAVIESPIAELSDGRNNSVIRYDYDVQGGKLENLEVTGGYWYGIMFWDWWDSNFETDSVHLGASGITLDGIKVHDTGVDAIKITPGADNITIINSEVYNTGRRSTLSADGIDNNNGDQMIVRNNYLHNIAGIGVLTSGGTIDSIIEQNLIKQTDGAGIVAGYYTELEWIDPNQNPEHFAAINPIVRNNIIVDAAEAGIGIYGAYKPLIANNTLVNTATKAQAPLQLAGYEMWVSNTAPSYKHIASEDVRIVNNIISNQSDNLSRMIDIREGAYQKDLTIDYNLYHAPSTRGAQFIDRNHSGEHTAEQSFSLWQSISQFDLHSQLADPQLSDDWHLSSASPAINAGTPLQGLSLDFDKQLRFADPPEPDADPPQPDLGADEFHVGTHPMTPPPPIGAPTLEFSAPSYHAMENELLEIAVTRQGSANDKVSVQFTFQTKSASLSDFIASEGTLIFEPGEVEKRIPVQFLQDQLPEGDEHFSLILSNATTNGSLPCDWDTLPKPPSPSTI